MTRPEYYSQRNKTNKKNLNISLEDLKSLFKAIHYEFTDKGYFEENFGGYNEQYPYPGKLGSDDNISNLLYLKMHKKGLWPYYNKYIIITWIIKTLY
jgi:hypothetical protein